MQNIQYRIVQPAQADRDACVALIAAGGEVETENLAICVANAHTLGVAYDGAQLVGVAAIKQPERTYLARLREKSEANLDEASLELGWVVTDEPYQRRGIARTLIALLTAIDVAMPLFATTRHAHVKHLLRQHGFVEGGTPYTTERSPIPLSVFVRA